MGSGQGTKECGRCGYREHTRANQACPAKGKQCNSCNKIGHFSSMCRSIPKKRKNEDNEESYNRKSQIKRSKNEVNTVETEEPSNKSKGEGTYYIFNLNDDAVIECEMGGVKLNVLIDSGCNLNVVTDKTWNRLKEEKIKICNEVKGTKKTLYVYGSKVPLDVKGTFDTAIRVNKKTEPATVYVINNGTRDLLGKETAIKLGVLKLGVEVNTVEQKYKPFPKFKDVLVEIPVNKKCQPVSQPYRRIPIPIEEKVENKIKELLDSDIIEEVHGPSPWISPVVPVLKDDNDLRLCVDMRRANEAILRENHPLPCMDTLLTKIRKAKWFSRLDIKNAFHQVEIHPNSRYLTTFITAKGLYRYKRLMFGITCAPELFKKIMERMLTGLDGIINFIDDILIFGEDEKQHDERLSKALETLKKNNVLLNKKKCIYKVQKNSFPGTRSDTGGN